MRLIIFFLLFSLTATAENILTPHGIMPVEKLNVGDTVIGRNGIKNILTAKALIDTAQSWYLINSSYLFYCNQSVFLAKGKYSVCHFSEVEAGDEIFNYDDHIAVVSIQSLKLPSQWYKLTISGDHSYYEDGILVHNASRFWNKQNASANWNASAPTNWGATSGGTGAAAPGASDDVTFDGVGTGGNAASTENVNVTIVSLSFTSGYTATISITANLTLGTGGMTDNTAHGWSNSGNLIMGGNSTITSNGKTMPGQVNFGNVTTTLSGNWTLSGTAIGGTVTSTINSGTGDLSCAGLTAIATITGTAKITLTGGTWSGATGTTQNNVDLAGNVTITTTGFRTGTLTYVSGTITTTGSTITASAGATWNTNGVSWNNVSLTAGTHTLNSLLTVTGTLILGATGSGLTLAGTAGFTTGTLSCPQTSATTITLVNNVTYTVTAAMNAFASRTGSILLFTSDHATNKAKLTLNQGATCSVLADFTRIDASNGRTINTFHGTLTSTINILSYTDYNGGSGSGSCLFVQ